MPFGSQVNMYDNISPLRTPRSLGNDTAKETQRSQKDIENGKNNIQSVDQVNGLMSSLRDIFSSRLTGDKGSETELSKLKEFTADFVQKIKAEEKKLKDKADLKLLVPIKTADNCKCKNFLLVDDEEFNLKATSNILEVMDPEILFWKVKDGDEAVDICKEMSESNPCAHCDFFRLIIMDINMPKLDGMEATKQILERNKKIMAEKRIAQGILVLGCTAYTDGNTKVEGKAIGMAHVMTKPFKRKHYIDSLVQIGLLPPDTIGGNGPLEVIDLLGSPKTNPGRSYRSVIAVRSQNDSGQSNLPYQRGLDSKLPSGTGSPPPKGRTENRKLV